MHVAFHERHFVHAIDGRRRFVLSQDNATRRANGSTTGRAIVPHAGHNNTHGVVPVHFGHTVHQHIDGRLVSTDGWTVTYDKLDERALATDGEVFSALCDPHAVRFQGIPLRRFTNRQRTQGIQPPGKWFREAGWHVLYDDDGRERRRQSREELRQGGRTTGGNPDRHATIGELACGRFRRLGRCWLDNRRVAHSRLAVLPHRQNLLHIGAGRHANLARQLFHQHGASFRPVVGFRQKIQGTAFERLKRRLGTRFGQ